jgi:hypothetical protein
MRCALIYRPSSPPPPDLMPELMQRLGAWLSEYGSKMSTTEFFVGGGGFGVIDAADSKRASADGCRPSVHPLRRRRDKAGGRASRGDADPAGGLCSGCSRITTRRRESGHALGSPGSVGGPRSCTGCAGARPPGPGRLTPARATPLRQRGPGSTRPFASASARVPILSKRARRSSHGGVWTARSLEQFGLPGFQLGENGRVRATCDLSNRL